MKTVRRTVIAIACAACLAAPVVVEAQESAGPIINPTPSAGAMAADLVLVRPLSLAASAVGVGLFVAQLPFDLLGWQSPATPARVLVVKPLEFTFTRKLGDVR